MASVTSRHNKAPETSRSVNPSCTPALSKSACRDRGAKRSRAFTTSNIFTLITYLECKGKKLSVIPQTFYPFFASLTPLIPPLFPSLPGGHLFSPYRQPHLPQADISLISMRRTYYKVCGKSHCPSHKPSYPCHSVRQRLYTTYSFLSGPMAVNLILFQCPGITLRTWRNPVCS